MHRLKADLVMVEEGQEPKDLCSLVGDKTGYDSMLNGEYSGTSVEPLNNKHMGTDHFTIIERLSSARNTHMGGGGGGGGAFPT